jgi:hypothetical protein
MGWPEVLAASRQSLPGDQSPLLEIPDWIMAREQQFEQPETENREFRFPNLTVTLNLPVTLEAVQLPQRQ